MPSRYSYPVDPAAANNSHAFALEMVGWNRRVLELGAAAGHVTRALVNQGCRVTSIEYERAAAGDLEGIAEQVVVGDLNAPDVFDGLRAEYDTVLAGDVLEHLLRPHDVLARAARLLKPDGRVVVSLPHVGHVDLRLALVQGTWDYRPYGLMDDTHTRFFTLKTITDLVKQAGLVITDMRRVHVPAFETELAVDRAAVPTDLLERILADPEAETYQFVFSAAVDTGAYRAQRLSDQVVELQRELERTQIALQVQQADDDELRLENSLLRAEVEENRAFVKRVHESVTWRAWQRMRRVAVTLLGGPRSPIVRGVQAMLRAIGRMAL